MNDETQQPMPGESTAPQPRSIGREIAKGIASCFLLNGVHLGIAWLLLRGSDFLRTPDFLVVGAFLLIFGFGVIQLIYVIPLILVLRRKGRRDFAKGIAIGASIAFLLNATCFGLVMTGKIRLLD